MPISTKMARINSVGINIGRPASDAPATARIEPDSQPAGTPRSPNADPPAAAMTSVSARWRKDARRSLTDGADKIQGSHGAKRTVRRGSLAAINAVRECPRQMLMNIGLMPGSYA
jgi:hypothetical protein